MNRETVHVIVNGRVQGVGFRWFTLQQAQRLGVTGYVTNKSDGSVEAILQGPQAKLNVLLDILAEGPPVSSVTKIDKTVLPEADEYQEFSITYK